MMLHQCREWCSSSLMKGGIPFIRTKLIASFNFLSDFNMMLSSCSWCIHQMKNEISQGFLLAGTRWDTFVYSKMEFDGGTIANTRLDQRHGITPFPSLCRLYFNLLSSRLIWLQYAFRLGIVQLPDHFVMRLGAAVQYKLAAFEKLTFSLNYCPKVWCMLFFLFFFLFLNYAGSCLASLLAHWS